MRFRIYNKDGSVFVDSRQVLGRERWFELNLQSGEDPGLSACELLVEHIVPALNLVELLSEDLAELGILTTLRQGDEAVVQLATDIVQALRLYHRVKGTVFFPPAEKQDEG